MPDIYVPSVGPRNATVALIGESPGEDEERLREPFVGRAGQILNTILTDAGLKRSECFIGNVSRYRPPGNKIDDWLRGGPNHVLGKHVHDYVYAGMSTTDGVRDTVRCDSCVAS